MPNYLDENGNRIVTKGRYLDENGNEIGAKNESVLDKASSYLSNLVHGLIPIDLAKSMYSDLKEDRYIGQSAFGGMIQAHKDQFAKGREANERGDYIEGFGHNLAGSVPLVGPQIAGLMEQSGSGDVAGALGGATAFGAMLGAPGMVGKGPKLKPSTYLNPKEAAAAQWAVKQGVEVPATALTGNPVLRGVEAATEAIPFAGGAIKRGQMKLADDIRNLSDTMKRSATPTATTADPMIAGQNVTLALTKKADEFDTLADIHYSKLREIAGRDIQQVPTGEMRPTGRLGGGGVPGSGIPEMEPVLEPMVAPVPYTTIKADMQKFAGLIREEMGSKALDKFKETNPGFAAIMDIADAPDFVPLSRALADKQAAAKIAFGRDVPPVIRNRSEGISASLREKLESVIQPKVQSLGPEAQTAYQAGKDATALKHGVADILKKIAGPNWEREPVMVYRALAQNEDAGAMVLKSVAKTTPSVVPDIAATTLEGILKPSLETGGYTNAKSAFNKWHRLGPETKQVLFGQNPDTINNLDQFFQFSQQAQRDMNPSGSGKVASMTAVGGLTLYSPLTGAATVLTARQVAKLLYSPEGAALVNEGLRIPVGTPAAASIYTAILSKTQQPRLALNKDKKK